MPKYLLNSKKSVLIHYPAGKRYISNLSDDGALVQSSQKGNTCEYYGTLCRPRLGEEVERLKDFAQQTADPDAIELVQLREIEKNISAHTKNITSLEIRDGLRQQLDNIPLKKAASYIKQLESELTNPKADIEEINLLIEALKEFKQQTTYNYFYDYLSFNHDKDLLKLHKNLLQTLGKNPIQAANELLHETGFPHFVSIDDLPPEEHETIYAIATNIARAEAHKLKHSALLPARGMDALLECLRTENVLSVTGKFGKAFYDVDPEEEGPLTEYYQVYSWNEDQFDRQRHPDNHKVIVVGADYINGKGYVYFVDPNDESKPGQPRKLYKISYEVFKSAIENVFGMDKKKPSSTFEEFYSQTPKAEAPFALYSEPGLEEQYASKYQKAKRQQQAIRFFNEKVIGLIDDEDRFLSKFLKNM